jgi:hypothetical protein
MSDDAAVDEATARIRGLSERIIQETYTPTSRRSSAWPTSRRAWPGRQGSSTGWACSPMPRPHSSPTRPTGQRTPGRSLPPPGRACRELNGRRLGHEHPFGGPNDVARGRKFRTTQRDVDVPGSLRLAALSVRRPGSSPAPENRGVPGSSPGLAISGARIPHACWIETAHRPFPAFRRAPSRRPPRRLGRSAWRATATL